MGLGMGTVQRSFDDLGTPLREVTFCVVDLETTGGRPEDQITEIGAVKYRAGELLGINRDQVRYRMEKFGLSKP